MMAVIAISRQIVFLVGLVDDLVVPAAFVCRPEATKKKQTPKFRPQGTSGRKRGREGGRGLFRLDTKQTSLPAKVS